MENSVSSPLDPILDAFGLTGGQREAAAERMRDVTVTAGAGSGKTRTLVARYLGLLAQGCQPGSVVAITFTEKAAREMRTRVRKELRKLVLGSQVPEERRKWAEMEARIDSARIGTIHSLCAEILRAHPAEAGLDPKFGVLDENDTVQLRSAAVEAALLAAVQPDGILPDSGHPDAGEPADLRAMFDAFSIGRLQDLLGRLLSKRLEVSADALDLAQCSWLVLDSLRRFLYRDGVRATLDGFRQGQADGSLKLDAGDKLAEQLVRLIALYNEAYQALEEAVSVFDGLNGTSISTGAPRDGGPSGGSASTGGRTAGGSENGRLANGASPVDAALTAGIATCGRALWQARREAMALTAGKKTSLAKEALRELREIYDAVLDPWLGGKSSASAPPDADLEAQAAVWMPLLRRLYQQALDSYRSALAERQALDFDDLEAGALALLQIPSVAARWQAETAAVLVDEFQDTNDRQRQLVQALCGKQPGRLFVVGDARQSIYRFRGADVTVFTGLQRQVDQQGGLRIDLDRTFRAHPGLLDATGSLLAGVMGDQPDPERLYYVPFAPLVSQRTDPSGGVQAPYVECVLGAGADSLSGRQAMARALAERLIELRATGEIPGWDSVALLFRASTGFPFYEEAFEAAGIPFVTVAGSGFYDRPEVRDLLNLLRALADPWDDQALAGFLRSPAIGLSDPSLYRLRAAGSGPGANSRKYRSLRQSLADREIQLESDQPNGGSLNDERALAARALEILDEFEPWVDRLPVAELLRRLIARVDYRSILSVSRSRLWRNIDKLLADAQSSGLVRVRAFLEHVDTLRDVGAREGESVSEAEGAVRLMTIHKSKGLEFPVVVLADAARQRVSSSDLAYPLGGGWTVSPNRTSADPLAYRLARHIDAQQSEAENGRVLYVALTRAMEKLIISGHLTVKEDGSCKANGWLQELLDAGGVDLASCLASCLAEPGTPRILPLPGGGDWRICLAGQDEIAQPAPAAALPSWPRSDALPLVEPLRTRPSSAPLVHIPQPAHAPVGVWSPSLSQVTGAMVHAALRCWRFEEDRPFEEDIRFAEDLRFEAQRRPADGPSLDALLRLHARQAGLLDGDELEGAMRVAKTLLARFRRHPLWAEIQAASERHHGIPCHTGLQGSSGPEYIDLLYRTGPSWTLVDFHTAPLKSQAELKVAFELRLAGLKAKQKVVEDRIGVKPRVLVCFLDVEHRVVLQEG